MKLKPVGYIRINDQKGALYSAGKQCLLVPVSFIKALDSVFIRLVGKKGADILIYKIGEAIGRSYAQNLDALLKKEKTKVSEETRIRLSCNAISMEAGWGRIKIQELDLAAKRLVAEITYSPSGELLEKTNYSVERGILAGIYQEIKKQEIYCQLLKERRGKHSAVLATIKEIPEEIKKKEKIVLFTRKKLEKLVQEKTKELQGKIDEMKKIQALTVGRELKMIELKKRIKEMKKQLNEEEKAENFLKEPFSEKRKKNCWDFWECGEEIRKNCPAFQSNSGRECWLVASSYCPHIKKGFKSCTQCPWFKKLN